MPTSMVGKGSGRNCWIDRPDKAVVTCHVEGRVQCSTELEGLHSSSREPALGAVQRCMLVASC